MSARIDRAGTAPRIDRAGTAPRFDSAGTAPQERRRRKRSRVVRVIPAPEERLIPSIIIKRITLINKLVGRAFSGYILDAVIPDIMPPAHKQTIEMIPEKPVGIIPAFNRMNEHISKRAALVNNPDRVPTMTAFLNLCPPELRRCILPFDNLNLPFFELTLITCDLYVLCIYRAVRQILSVILIRQTSVLLQKIKAIP